MVKYVSEPLCLFRVSPYFLVLGPEHHLTDLTAYDCSFTLSEIRRLMDRTDNVRNMTVIAHG